MPMSYRSPKGEFRTVALCAYAHGVAVSTVHSMLQKHGDLDRLGIGKGRRGNSNRSKPCDYRGMRFKSQLELAQWMGCAPSTAAKRLKQYQDSLN